MAFEDLAREALEPFAKAATGVGTIYRDEDRITHTPHIAMILTVGDLRRARTAYDAIGSGVKADEIEAAAARILDKVPFGYGMNRDDARMYASAALSTHTAAGAGPVGEAVAWEREAGATTTYTGPNGNGLVVQGYVPVRPAEALAYFRGMLPETTTNAGAGPVAGDFVLVPREPTEAMLIDGVCAYLAHDEADDAKPTVTEVIYRAMIAARPVEEPGEVERLTRELRMIVSHATAGRTDGVGMSVNDVCVAITALRNELWQEARKKPEAALAETRERLEKAYDEAARICFVTNTIDPRHAEATVALKWLVKAGARPPEARAALTGDAQEANR